MKICVIGNSHVGALKRAWDEICDEYLEHNLTFFAMGSTGINGLAVQNGKLIATTSKLRSAIEFTSGGLTEVIPESYDAFLVYGLSAIIRLQDINFYYSSAVRKQALLDVTSSSLSFTTIKKLRAVTSLPIYVGHNPLKASRVISTMDRSQDYSNHIEQLNSLVYSSENAQLIPQPANTLVNGVATKEEYTLGSRTLAVVAVGGSELHDKGDNFHMNDVFGEVWLRNFFVFMDRPEI